MYSEQYTELFEIKMDYDWEQKSSVPFVRNLGSVRQKFEQLFGWVTICLIVVCAIFFLTPLSAIVVPLLCVSMYLFFIRGIGSSSNAEEYAKNNYIASVQNVLSERLNELEQSKRTDYLDLLLSENEKSLSRREGSYNKIRTISLGYFVPFFIFIYTLFSSTSTQSRFILKFLTTKSFVSFAITLIIVICIIGFIIGSRNTENYLLMELSNPYWKHRVINKVILDEKYNIMTNKISKAE